MQEPSTLQEKVVHEIREFLAISVYLALFFSAFVLYRQTALAPQGIPYMDFGFVLIKSIVLGKVILLGRHIRIMRALDHRPLIRPTLYKVILAALLCILFELLEAMIRGLLHGESVAHGIDEILVVGGNELLARILVMTIAFIPLFAFWELDQALGRGRLMEMFLGRKTPAGSGDASIEPSTQSTR